MKLNFCNPLFALLIVVFYFAACKNRQFHNDAGLKADESLLWNDKLFVKEPIAFVIQSASSMSEAQFKVLT